MLIKLSATSEHYKNLIKCKYENDNLTLQKNVTEFGDGNLHLPEVQRLSGIVQAGLTLVRLVRQLLTTVTDLAHDPIGLRQFSRHHRHQWLKQIL